MLKILQARLQQYVNRKLPYVNSKLDLEKASLVVQLVKNLPAMQETPVWFLGQEDPWRRDRLPTLVFLDFPGGSAGKESACNVGDLGSIPGLGRSPRGRRGNPLQYSDLENSMDRIVHGVAELVTTEWLSQSSQRNQRSSCQHPLDHRKGREFQKSIYFCFIDYDKAFDSVEHNKLWKVLKEMGIPGHLTCLLRNLYACQEAPLRNGHRTMDWFKIGKGLHQGCILSPYLSNLYAE